MCYSMIKTSSVLPRESSVIFGNFQRFLENVRKRLFGLQRTLRKFSEIFGKCSEIFGKSLKESLLVCLYNKQNITCPFVDMDFILWC